MRNRGESGIALITALLILLLVSSIIVGFSWLVMTDQRLGGATSDRQRAFYGAEAGMEKLTADLGNLFSANYSPRAAQINTLTAPDEVPNLPGIQFLAPDGSSGYLISFPPNPKNGNPLAQVHTILSGPYQGMVGLLTPYSLTVIARTDTGGEVKLQRVVQTVGIPAFQFGIFSQTDLSFFAGPCFDFGGRVHTNGNLFLAEGGGCTLTLSDRVTAWGEVIRTNLSNGWPTTGGYTGTVNLITSPGTYRAMQMTEGSLLGTLGSPANPTWPNVSLGIYNGNIRNHLTGAKQLNLAIATPQMGGSPIDLIRRPIQGEDASAPGKLGERYFAQASLKILLSDDPTDIMSLPCIDASKPPRDLSTLATTPLPSWYTSMAASEGTIAVPLAASGAGASYSSSDGYWLLGGRPIITGFIKIEIQTSYGVPCGTWQDVTDEILGLGVAGRNTNPVSSIAPPTLPALPSAQIAPSTCADPNPNAVIRFERVRDNPSTLIVNAGCGVDLASNTVPPNTYDYWPNALFDPREANERDWCPNGVSGGCTIQPMFAGVMYYVELDTNNLARWFTGAIGTSGPLAKDNNIAPHDFVVYFSDRRSNYTPAPIPGILPSPTRHETGEFGFEDFINPGSPNACPNNVLDTGEDLDALGGAPLMYGANAGQAPYPGFANLWSALFSQVTSTTNVLEPNWTCPTPTTVWPGWYVNNAQEARENPALFFRRALKIVNGDTINLGVCPNGVNCGIAIASENPVYIQGNFNAPGGAFGNPHVAASVVADAVTLLSNGWNDVNSFSSTYSTGWRAGSTTWYRLAIGAGKQISFPQPLGYSTPQDFGTDGGVHNFLRFIEDWGGSTLNYRGSIVSFYYNRQGIGLYKCCDTVYSPPTRAYNFDTEFLTPDLLPPRTPMFRDVNTIGFTQYILPN